MTSRRLSRLGVAAATVVLALAVAAPPALAVDTARVIVYYDLDNDGVRDPGEPGIPGQALSGSTGDVTDNAGRGRVRPTTQGRVRLSTGWYRSGCTALFCDAAEGAGTDNDFHVRNQFILLDGAVVGATYHVGLVPDWPGNFDAMPSNFLWDDDGDGVLESSEATGSVNQVDVATRLSWGWSASAACNRSGTRSDRACRPGDRPRIQFQVMNEGARTLRGVSGILEMPFEAPLTASPSTQPLNQPGLGLAIGSYDPISGGYPWTITGPMRIGAVAQFTLRTTIPDVVRASPSRSSKDHVVVNRVTSVQQWKPNNDPDSAHCGMGPAAACNPVIGHHDKQGSLADDSDGLAFTIVDVDPALDPGDVHDLALVQTATAPGSADPGDLVAFGLRVVNQGTRAVRNPAIIVTTGSGLSFARADNPGWSTAATTVLQGQLAAGASATTTVRLRLAPGATTAMNGTAQLRVLAEVAEFFDAETGSARPPDVDSLPDRVSDNDGYDLADPWDSVGDDVITDGASTSRTSAGGEDDQDPAWVTVAGRVGHAEQGGLADG